VARQSPGLSDRQPSIPSAGQPVTNLPSRIALACKSVGRSQPAFVATFARDGAGAGPSWKRIDRGRLSRRSVARPADLRVRVYDPMRVFRFELGASSVVEGDDAAGKPPPAADFAQLVAVNAGDAHFLRRAGDQASHGAQIARLPGGFAVPLDDDVVVPVVAAAGSFRLDAGRGLHELLAPAEGRHRGLGVADWFGVPLLRGRIGPRPRR